MNLLDRISLALAAEEGVSDPVTPQIIQADGQLSQVHDAAKFAMQGAGDALEAISNMATDAMKFVGDLRALTELPPETQQAFEAHEDGFALTRIQDIVGDLEAFEKNLIEAHRHLAEAVKAADRYRSDITGALGQPD